MGLDMFLIGERYFPEHNEKYFSPEYNNGYKVKSKQYDLGYWRKHPNLHGFIVDRFANGVDDCKKIELTEDNLQQIIQAVKENNMPQVHGFFFGESCNTNKQNTEIVLQKALKWLKIKEEGVWRSVWYQASW